METYEVHTRFVTDGLTMRLFASSSFILVEARAANYVMFSVGAPNHGSRRTERLTSLPGIQSPVYVSADPNSRADAVAWLQDGRHADLIAVLTLAERETINTYAGAVTFLFRATRELTDDLIAHLVALVRALETVLRSEPINDYSDLSLPLRKLMLEFGRFAASDDMERAELSENISSADKKRLISTIQPLFPATNRYLDEHQTTASAPALGALAEFAVELLNEQRSETSS